FQLILAESSALVLLLGTGLGVAGVRLVGHRIISALLLLLGRACLFRQAEILRRHLGALGVVQLSHDFLLRNVPHEGSTRSVTMGTGERRRELEFCSAARAWSRLDLLRHMRS